MTEVSEHVNVPNPFHDVNLILCEIQPKAGIFHSENLVLSTVTSIHNIRKRTKYRNSETR